VTKSELIAALTDRYPQLAARDVGDAVSTILDALSQALAQGQRIEVRGFGSFSVSQRAPRLGRNPKSGENVLVPGKQVGERAILKSEIPPSQTHSSGVRRRVHRSGYCPHSQSPTRRSGGRIHCPRGQIPPIPTHPRRPYNPRIAP